MARPSRRRRDDPSQATAALVLDSEELSRVASGDHRAAAWIARAREQRVPVVLNAVTLTETIRGSARDAQIHRIARRAHIDAVDAEFAAEAGRLLGATRRADTVDALVAVTAIRLQKPVTILTSDSDDLHSLTAEHPRINVVRI